jgi:Fe-Mn family superoxide dismutase
MFELPALPYNFDALEPHIDSKTMEIHHDRHHAAYVKNLNAALENYPQLREKSLTDLLTHTDSLPAEIRQKVINHGGGHANHSLFWQVMSPNGGGEPKRDLMTGLTTKFGSFANFKKDFTKAATTLFGSGWAWLVLDGRELEVTTTPNQNSPLMEGKVPLLGLDVWEHAYYLKYQNRRPEYVEVFWKVVNWEQVGQNYNEATS